MNKLLIIGFVTIFLSSCSLFWIKNNPPVNITNTWITNSNWQNNERIQDDSMKEINRIINSVENIN